MFYWVNEELSFGITMKKTHLTIFFLLIFAGRETDFKN